jgi:putative transposase
MADLFIAHGTPAHIRSDQGKEFITEAAKAWITAAGSKAAYIEKASPRENGYVESVNGNLRDELLNGEVFSTLREAEVLIEAWRIRPRFAASHRRRSSWTVPARADRSARRLSAWRRSSRVRVAAGSRAG